MLLTFRTDEVYKALSILAMGTWHDVYKYIKHGWETNLFHEVSAPKIVADSIIQNIDTLKKCHRKNQFDAVIVIAAQSNCVLAHLLDIPVITLSPGGPIRQLLEGLGTSINPVTQPSFMSPFIEPMTFIQRLTNILIENVWYLAQNFNDNKAVQLISEEINVDIPNIETIMKQRNVLGLINSHFVTHGTWPYYKNVAEIGGVHCKPGQQLPEELQQYMDSHNEGVVYVSFGSALKPSQMPNATLKVFHDAFKELNVPIIWKWDSDDVTGIPKNVKVLKWTPQNDLLSHPNLKVIVTHGGLLSIQEALYHKVPIVGIPLALDQTGNLLRAERNGYGIKLSLKGLNKMDMVSAIQRAMNDEQILTSTDSMHNLFTEYYDQTPMERAIKAIEYVIENRNSSFLKPIDVSHISWYQFYGYDIFAFVSLAIFVVLSISLKCTFSCLRMCRHKKSKQD